MAWPCSRGLWGLCVPGVRVKGVLVEVVEEVLYHAPLDGRVGAGQGLQSPLACFHPYNCGMSIYQLDDKQPVLDPSAFVADSAQVMGDVVMGPDSSVWFGAVVRGDTETITIGAGSNVQDTSVLHADHGYPLTIGERVTVGHQVMLHGCTIGDESLIGIGAVVLNGAQIGRNCLVGAGSLVTEGKVFPDGSMILGSPARVVRQLSPEQIEGLRRSAQSYMANARRYRAGLKKLG